MQKTSILVIGGGASGIVAAISAKRKGSAVVICERLPKLGKKILASGNGRCNLLNEKLGESFYNPSARPLVKSVFAKINKNFLLDFFKGLGLELHSEAGRMFPATNQSSSVLKVLEIELRNLSIGVELNFEFDRISHSKGRFAVTSKNNKNIECEKLIIAGGGKSYPALGSDGSCYNLAEKLGHRIVEPVPSAVGLVVKDRLCHILQGQKISASLKPVIDGIEMPALAGELLFTKYGLSGSGILDVSEDISIAINRDSKKDVYISADMVPFMKEDILAGEIAKRINRKLPPEELTVGILPNKFGLALKDEFNNRKIDDIVRALKRRLFRVTGTRGWNEAEFTSGGVDTNEVIGPTLESKSVKGLYFAGEVLDVCGKRGGYNLAWAWASGFQAGLTE